MPHGAGRIGGHHHGGGGFHHHRHHAHHHHRGTWWWWGGAGPYSPYGVHSYRRRGACWLILISIFVVIAVPVAISFSLRFGVTNADDIDYTREYTLTDKVIRTYNSDFCQGLKVKSSSVRKHDASKSNATLYLLSSSPPLTDTEKFNFSADMQFSSKGDDYDWNFYLNEGSNAHFSACYEPGSSSYSGVVFYVIRGRENFHKWQDDPDNSDNVAESFAIFSANSYCTSVAYTVTVSDRYYFAFYSRTFIYVSLDANLTFVRTVYHISPVSVVRKCTIPLNGYSSCSIDVPMSSDYTAVLSLNTSKPVDYENDRAAVKVDCLPRVWLYAVIAVCSVLPLIIVTALVIVCVYVAVKRQKQRYTPLISGAEQIGKDAFEDSGNINVAIRPPGATTAARSAPSVPPHAALFPPPREGGYGATDSTTPPYTQ